MDNVCAFCGKEFEGEGWPHVEGDSNRGVSRIEQFCSEEHRTNFLKSNL
jgi:ribosomal protein L24E